MGTPIFVSGMRGGSTLLMRGLLMAGMSLGRGTLNKSLEDVYVASFGHNLGRGYGGPGLIKVPPSIPETYPTEKPISWPTEWLDPIPLARQILEESFGACDGPCAVKRANYAPYARFWGDVLEDTPPRFVLIVREPLEWATSVQRWRGATIPAALALWHWYAQRSLQETASFERLVVTHAQIVGDIVGTVGKVAEFAGGAAPSPEQVKQIAALVDPGFPASTPADAALTEKTAALWAAIQSGVATPNAGECFYSTEELAALIQRTIYDAPVMADIV